VAKLSLVVFSSDDWRRPAQEVSALMSLLRHDLRTELTRNVVRRILAC
jgi:undecaprenyl diphosphate synthase